MVVAMKAYAIRDGVMSETWIPDGALLLEVGSRRDPIGVRDLPPIEAIGHTAGRYRREGQRHWSPIPDRVVALRDLEWTAVR